MVNSKDFYDEDFQRELWEKTWGREREYIPNESIIDFERWYYSGEYSPRTRMVAGRYVNHSIDWTIPKGLKKLDVELELISFKQPDVRSAKAAAGFFLTSSRDAYIDNLEEDMKTLLKSDTILVTALDLEEYPISDFRFVMNRGRSKGESFQDIMPRLFDNEQRRLYMSEGKEIQCTSVDAERLDDYTIRVYISAGVTPNTPDFNDLVFNLKFEAPLSECKVGFKLGDPLYLI